MVEKLDFDAAVCIIFGYSFIISCIFLNYYSKRESNVNNCFCTIFISIILVCHLSLFFAMPMLLFINVEKENNCPYKNDVKKLKILIESIGLINAALNNFIYPFLIIYFSSGYFSLLYIFTRISIKEFIFYYAPIIIILILAVIYFTFQNFFEYIYENYIVFFLNFSNLYNVLYLYFLIGFSVGAIVRDFYKYFKLEDEYNSFLLGKLFFYEKETKESFKKYYEELLQINIGYLENEKNINLKNKKETDNFSEIKKEIQNFFEEINSLKYCRYDNEENIINNVNSLNNVLNLNELEKLIAKPYKECKDLKRKLEKIDYLRTNEINKIKGIKNNSQCCESKCCKSKCCKITKYIFFAVICLAILGSEEKYYEQYQHEINYNKTALMFYNINNNKTNNNATNYNNVALVIGNIILYPLFYFIVFFLAGIYYYPFIYSIRKRTFITGEFFYGKKCSDMLGIITSVKEMTKYMNPLFYLNCLYYLAFIRKEKFTVFTKHGDNPYVILEYFKFPYTKLVLTFKYAILLLFILITRSFERINFICFNINICDECTFEPRDKEPCLKKCLEGKRNDYIQQGLSERQRLLNNDIDYIPLN